MTFRRMRAVKLFAVGVLSFVGIALTSIDAMARSVCLHDQFASIYVFNKAPKLKPAKPASLVGLYILNGIFSPVPFDGSATMNGAGTLTRFGIFVHSLSLSTNNISVEWTGDPGTFAGSGFYDNAGTYQSAGTMTLTAVDCATVSVP